MPRRAASILAALAVVLLVAVAPAGAHYVGLIYYPPAVDDEGTLYVSGTDGILYALDGDGRPRWTYDASAELMTRARVDDGRVFVGTIDGHVHAVWRNGTAAWTAGVGAGKRTPVASLVVGDDRTYALTGEAVHALDRETGTEHWQFAPTDQATAVAVAENRVYVVEQDVKTATLYALTPDGDRVWNRSYRGDATAPAVATDGTVYVEAGGTLYALSPAGDRRWSVRTGELWRRPALDGSRLVVGTFDGRVLAVEDGQVRWEYAVGDAVAPAVGPGGRVYAVTNDAVVAIEDGRRRWRTRIGPTVLARPTVVGDRVYVGTQLNRTYALSTDGSIAWIDRYATPFGYGIDLPPDAPSPSVLGNATGTPTRVVPATVPASDRGTDRPLTGTGPRPGFGIVAILAGLVVIGAALLARRSWTDSD